MKNIKTKHFLALLAMLLFYCNDLNSQTEPITMLFGGDCTFANSSDGVIKNNFNKPFGSIPWIAKADITMVNLENCISLRGTKVTKQFNFRMHPKYLQVLKNGGIDIVNVANNHIIDYGTEAFDDSFYYLDSIGIKYVGAGRNLQEARKPVVFNSKGKKIGFLGYHDSYTADAQRYGSVPTNSNIIKEDIRSLKEEQKVDYVVVNFHWGEEKSNTPTNEQKFFARLSIDAGADLVIGHHPHVLQGVEHYKEGYIVYSLGNLIFGGKSRREHDTMIFKLTIDNGKLILEIIPIHVSNYCVYDVGVTKRDCLLQMIDSLSQGLNDSK